MRPNLFAFSAFLAVLASAAAGYRAGTGQWPLPGRHEHTKAEATAPAERKVLYYRNPMGHPDTSPTPKKDEMGMDYIPVYAETNTDGASFKISLDKVQRAGVRTVDARLEKIGRSIRAPGIAKPNERTLRTISLRADGFIEKLYANELGKHVKAGEPLFRVYSQEMLRALVDFRLGSGAGQALLTAEQKLHNLEVPDAAIAEARRSRDVPMSFDWPSPVTGIITGKNVIEGQMAKVGDEIFRISDLTKIWVIANVAEQDIASIKIGAPAKVQFRALAGETFDGKVTFVLHELDPATRTGQVRIEVDNPKLHIRHEMFADVTIDTSSSDEARVTVPESAVLDSGSRQVVLVDLGEGRFEPRNVKLGKRGDDLIEIREGLQAGERVVVSANFLIDAESNLRAALSAFKSDGTNDMNKEPSK